MYAVYLGHMAGFLSSEQALSFADIVQNSHFTGDTWPERQSTAVEMAYAQLILPKVVGAEVNSFDIQTIERRILQPYGLHLDAFMTHEITVRPVTSLTDRVKN